MVSQLIAILNIFKHLFPFLLEATKEDNLEDEEDRAKARLFRRAIRSWIFKLFLFAILFFVVFYYTIPIYSENVVLEHEIEKLKITDKEDRQLVLNVQNQNSRLLLDLKAKEIFIDELSNKLAICKAKDISVNTNQINEIE